jgi:branched-chain amino acid transport system permease protein
MKSEKFLSGGEIFSLVLMGLLAVIMGGYTAIPLALLGGALVGVGSTVVDGKPDFRKALIKGGLISLVVVIGCFVRNELVSQLPKQEEIPEGAHSPLIYLLGLVAGIAMALLLTWLRGNGNEQIRKYGPLAVLAALAIAFPFFDRSTGIGWAPTIIAALIFCLQALGLNIVAGYAGLLDLGYVAFFAIGGYTAAFLAAPSNAWEGLGGDGNWHVPFWLIIWIAAAAAALFGLILGAPTLPLRGDYLAIVTLGFGEIVPIVFKNLEAVKIYEPISRLVAMFGGNFDGGACLVGCVTPLNITNGNQGLNPIDPPLMPFIEPLSMASVAPSQLSSLTFKPDQNLPWYFLILIMLVASAFFINRLRNSRIGRAFVAMREDELAASSMGVPLVKTKLTAFMIGALFSGFAGAFYASRVSFISPDAFDFSVSVIVLCMVILGGTGSITGVILGGLIIKVVDLLLLDRLQSVLNGVLQVTVFDNVQSQGVNLFLASLLDMTQYKLLLFGVILVVMMLVRPQGLVPEAMTKRKGT